MPTIRSKPKNRKTLRVWLPEAVHDALTIWVNERDQTIQGTVRRMVEAGIEYEGPEVPAEPVESGRSVDRGAAYGQQPNVYPTTPQWNSAPVVREPPKTMSGEEADAQYLANRRKGYDPGKSRRVMGATPRDWVAPEPLTARRTHPLWNTEEQFVNWYCRGESVDSARQRASDDPDWAPPAIKPEWEAARLVMAQNEEPL